MSGIVANFGSILYRCLLIEHEMMKFSQVFTRDAIASDHSWADLPEMEHTWARPEHYVRAYLSDPDAWWWSTNDYTQGESEVVLKRVLAIIAQARMPEHEKALGQLGSGPLENMMSDGLLDILHSGCRSALQCATRLTVFGWRLSHSPCRSVCAQCCVIHSVI